MVRQSRFRVLVEEKASGMIMLADEDFIGSELACLLSANFQQGM